MPGDKLNSYPLEGRMWPAVRVFETPGHAYLRLLYCYTKFYVLGGTEQSTKIEYKWIGDSD